MGEIRGAIGRGKVTIKPMIHKELRDFERSCGKREKREATKGINGLLFVGLLFVVFWVTDCGLSSPHSSRGNK